MWPCCFVKLCKHTNYKGGAKSFSLGYIHFVTCMLVWFSFKAHKFSLELILMANAEHFKTQLRGLGRG
jgi:hypothetical protein